MISRVKVFLQYFVILGITAFLVWFSLRAIQVEEGQNKWDYILDTWYAANKMWLVMVVIFVMISHVIRAERWRMLLHSVGHKTSLYNGFLSLLIGYLVNLAIPRGGEVSRCYNLYRLDKIPVEVSFGTVVVERIADVICLIIVLLAAFAVESEKLWNFVASLPIQPLQGVGKLGSALIIVVAIILVSAIMYWILIRNERIRLLLNRVWSGFKTGLTSVYKLESKGLFVVYSVAIWVLYFLMTYAVIKAFDQTGHLGFSAMLSLFAIGTIAMAAPLPGGAGSYHVLIPAGLVFLYQLPEANAVAFTFVFHGWQTLIMIVGGVVAMLLTAFSLKSARKTDEKTKVDEIEI